MQACVALKDSAKFSAAEGADKTYQLLRFMGNWEEKETRLKFKST